MKLPRWLTLCLLGSSMLVVFATAGWWWVTWPERTARQFVWLMISGRARQVEREFGLKLDVLEDVRFTTSRLAPRTPMDIICGRLDLDLEGDAFGGGHAVFHLTVNKNKVEARKQYPLTIIDW